MDTSASTASNGNIPLKDIKTRALVVAQPKADFVMQTVFYDEVREDEYLIEMKYSGICHTVRFLSNAP
jgi:Zn-dependent alcohol dehydrogenase